MENNQTQSTAGLLDLPEEVVRQILHYFSEKDRVWKIGMTCRTLLAYSVYNVHEIEMPPGTEKATLDKLKLMLNEPIFADWIRYVMLLGDQSKKQKQAAHEELPELRYKRGTFIMYGKAANDIAILHLARNCRNIDAFVMLRSNNFTNGRIRYLARKCRGITHLCINSHSIHDDGLNSISEFLPQLKYLNLKDCDNLTSNGFKEAANKLTNLTELYMDNCRLVDDEAIKPIAQNCRDLEHLSIASCTELTDESIFYITACLPSLKYLDISRIRMTDIALNRVSQFCRQLETLIISELSNETTIDGVCKVLKHSGSHLINLDLSLCTQQVTDNVIFTIGGCCTSIQNLNLYYDSQLTDQSLVTLGLKCRDLKNLNIAKCHLLSDDGVSNLQQALPTLQVIGADDIQ